MGKLNFYKRVIENGEEKITLVFSEEYSYAERGIVDFYLGQKYEFRSSNKIGTIIEWDEFSGLSITQYRRVKVKFDCGNTQEFTLSQIYHDINNIPIPH